VEVLRWEVGSVKQPRTITVIGEVGHCVGHPKPRSQLPHIGYRGRNVYIMLVVEVPHQKQGTACAGVEVPVRRIVTLKRTLSEVKIYDSSSNPPALRWPRSR